MPEVEIKGLVLVRLDEGNRLVGQTVGDVFSVRAVGDGASRIFRTGLGVQGDAIGGEVVGAGRTRAGLGMKGDLESVLFRPVLAGQADVPFAEVAGGITGLGERLGQGDQVRVKVVLAGGIEEGLVTRSSLGVAGGPLGAGRLVTAGGGYTVPRRVLSAENGRPCRRTERVGVGIGEEHRLLGQLVHVGRLVVFRTIDPAIHPAHVVDQEEHDVWLVSRLNRKCGEGKEGENCFHCFFIYSINCISLYIAASDANSEIRSVLTQFLSSGSNSSPIPSRMRLPLMAVTASIALSI